VSPARAEPDEIVKALPAAPVDLLSSPIDRAVSPPKASVVDGAVVQQSV